MLLRSLYNSCDVLFREKEYHWFQFSWSCSLPIFQNYMNNVHFPVFKIMWCPHPSFHIHAQTLFCQQTSKHREVCAFAQTHTVLCAIKVANLYQEYRQSSNHMDDISSLRLLSDRVFLCFFSLLPTPKHF